MGRYESRWSCVTVLLLTGLLAAGCSGSDGPPGAPGAPGQPGQPGPTGPAGSGAVPVTSAEKINVHIDGVAVPAGGGAPTVSFTLTNDLNQGLSGLPAANIGFLLSQLSPGQDGGSSEWQAYTTKKDGAIENAQATTESGATPGAEYTDNGDGTYTYKFSKNLPDYPAGPVYDGSKTHRIGVEIRTKGLTPSNIPANNAPTDFLPTGGTPLFTRLIVDSDTCNACHDNLEKHGDARFDVEYCVQCHNPSSIDGQTGNTVDMKRLIHNIHSARADYEIVGRSVHEWGDLEWPQDIRNCQTCHEEDDLNTPQASNWRQVANRAACGTCHYDDGVANSGHDYAIENGTHPGGFQFTDDTQCIDCHGPTGTVTNQEGRLVQTPIAHEIREKTAGKAFKYNILSVVDTAPGDKPTITFSVTNPENDPVTAYDINGDAPFKVCSGGASRLYLNIGWSTTDYANIGSGNLPGLPISINVLGACGGTSSNTGGNIFEVTSPTEIPATATGSLVVAMEGHPAVDVYDDGSPERIAVKNAVYYAAITGSVVERRSVVDIEKCDDCHNELAHHGDNRTDEPEACVVCHNPMMTDKSQRDGGTCLAELGPDDASIDFKYLIHAAHASGQFTKEPYDVCGYGKRARPIMIEYPGRINNCEGCHLAGTYYPVDTAKVFGTTIRAGDTSILTDDVVISPNTAVCSACHKSDLAAVHMEQNGGDFDATKAEDGSLVSSGIESCAVCHGPGRVGDVKLMHKVETFKFN